MNIFYRSYLQIVNVVFFCYGWINILHTSSLNNFIQTKTCWIKFKPQDSFGEFNKLFLDLQKVQEIIKKTTIRPSCNRLEWHIVFVMQYCPMANYHYVHNLWQRVRGDSKHFYVFGLIFPGNGSISERTVNRALINSSKKVWKSEFDQLLLSYLSNNRHMLGIIRKIFKFSVKWYPTCYDYGLHVHGGAVLWNVG